MPREVWDPDKPSAAFTPRRQPLSVKKTDPFKYMKSPSLASAPFKLGKQPGPGILYKEPKETIALNLKRATKKADKTVKHIPYVPPSGNGEDKPTKTVEDTLGGTGGYGRYRRY